jgi:hypothetical protein
MGRGVIDSFHLFPFHDCVSRAPEYNNKQQVENVFLKKSSSFDWDIGNRTSFVAAKQKLEGCCSTPKTTTSAIFPV